MDTPIWCRGKAIKMHSSKKAKQCYILRLALFYLTLLSTTPTFSQEIRTLTGSSPLFPDSISVHQTPYNKLFKILDKSLPNINIEHKHSDIRRTTRELENGLIDFHFPILCDDIRDKNAPVLIGSEPMGFIPFGLFSRSSMPLTREDLLSAKYRLNDAFFRKMNLFLSEKNILELKTLPTTFDTQGAFLEEVQSVLKKTLNKNEQLQFSRAAYPFVVETIQSHIPFVGIPAYSDISPSNSVKKLIRNRIDAYIFPPLRVEEFIAKEDISGLITREVYSLHQGCALVTNSARGKQVNKLLSIGFKELKKNGHYDMLFSETDDRERAWVQKYQKP